MNVWTAEVEPEPENEPKSRNKEPRLPASGAAWPGKTLVASGLATISAAAVGSMENPFLGFLTLGVGIGCAVTKGTSFFRRQDDRTNAAENLCEVIASEIGEELTRDLVTVNRWCAPPEHASTQRWPEHPREMTLRIGRFGVIEPSDKAKINKITMRLFGLKFGAARFGPSRKKPTVILSQPTWPKTTILTPTQNRVLAVCKGKAGNQCSVSDWKFDDQGGLVGFQVVNLDSSRLTEQPMRRRLATSLDSMLPGRWRIDFNLTSDEAIVTARPEMPRYISLPSAKVSTEPKIQEMRLRVGVDENQETLTWSPCDVPHALVAGQTGTGKTVLLRSLALQWVQHGHPVWIIDGKGTEFLDLHGYPGVQLISGHTEEHICLLGHYRNVMNARREAVRQGKARESDFLPILLIVDEWTQATEEISAVWKKLRAKGQGATATTFEIHAQIARLSRSIQLYSVTGMQAAVLENMAGKSSDVRNNMGMRIALGRMSTAYCQMLFGSEWDDTRAQVNKGRGLMSVSTGGVKEVQTYYVPSVANSSPEAAAVLDPLKPEFNGHGRLLFNLPDLDDPELEFSDIEDAPLVRAIDRPDLDPLELRKRYEHLTPIERAEMVETGRLLGIEQLYTPKEDDTEEIPRVDLDKKSLDQPGPGEDIPGEEMSVSVKDLQEGDVLYDDGKWWIVDSPPVPDPLVDDDEAWMVSQVGWEICESRVTAVEHGKVFNVKREQGEV